MLVFYSIAGQEEASVILRHLYIQCMRKYWLTIIFDISYKKPENKAEPARLRTLFIVAANGTSTGEADEAGPGD